MKIEQCGFCGRFFRGTEFVTDTELDTLKREIDKGLIKLYDEEGKKIDLGYCPEANAEAQWEGQNDI